MVIVQWHPACVQAVDKPIPSRSQGLEGRLIPCQGKELKLLWLLFMGFQSRLLPIRVLLSDSANDNCTKGLRVPFPGVYRWKGGWNSSCSSYCAISGSALGGAKNHGLCEFACSLGYCPDATYTLGYVIYPDDKCQKTDVTLSRETMRAGSHDDIPMLDTSAPAASNEQYITIVNMTPYRFRYLPAQPSSYKVVLDFGDIPPGHFRQCVTEHAMSGDERKDDKAESYFEVGIICVSISKPEPTTMFLNTINLPLWI
ncbi:hypothetical protein K456DRAFT_36101 [Colletotrichum gloeosporioides 23]|nr:hypothetical protein K456DRAFT_36101 [Colletotrichum gloeosporioides 23]